MGALVCLNRLFSSFWPGMCILSNLFGPTRTLQNRPQDRHFCWHLPRKKSPKKCRFRVEKFESPNKLLKRHRSGQNRLNKRSVRFFQKRAKNLPFFGHFWKKSLFGHFWKKAIFAIFRRLHLRRVLSDWAENYVRALPCPKEFPYQFSAKTDSTRRRCGPRKNAIFGLKGGTLSI